MLVLAIGAHPDDETMFAGGMLARYAAAGHDVYILLTTRGEGGDVGEPPLCSREELGALREQEARNAAAALHAQKVMFLPFVDPLVGPDDTLSAVDATPAAFSDAIATVIGSLLPDVILTHGSNGEYGHPQHIFTHTAVFEALHSLRPWQPQEVLTWCAAYPEPERPRYINQDDPADIVLDVTPWLPQKIAAAKAYQSQHALFLRRNPDRTLDSVVITTESFRRQERRRG